MNTIRITSRPLIQLPIIALLVLGLVGCSGGGGGECPVVFFIYGGCGLWTGPSSGTGVPPPTVPPDEARNASVLAADEGIFVLWDHVPWATSYNIYYASSPGVTKTNYSTLPNGHKITGAISPQTITGRDFGMDYYFVVTSTNAYGESAESSELSVPKLPDTVPTNFISAQALSPWGAINYHAKFFEINDPQISSNSYGDAVVVWAQSYNPEVPFQQKIYAATYKDGIGWSSATSIGDENYQEKLPMVSIDKYGNALATWIRGGESVPKGCDRSLPYGYYCLVSSSYKPGVGWTDPVVIPMAESKIGLYRLVMDEQGNALVNLYKRENQSWVVAVLGYDSVSGWSQVNEMIVDYGFLEGYLISDNNGGALAVWEDWVGNASDISPKIFYSEFTWGNGWSAPVELGDGGGKFTNQFRTLQNIANPRIALSSSGNMVVAWTKKISGDSKNQLMASYFSPSTGWSGQTSIEDSAGDAKFAAVGIDASGNAMVIWLQDNGTNDVVRANNYIPGLGWGEAYDIGGDVPGDSGDPSLVMSDSGNATAVWTHVDSLTNSIVGNKYNAAMGWSGPELISLDYTFGPGKLRIDIGKDDKTLVAWGQYLDGIGTKIKAGMY